MEFEGIINFRDLADLKTKNGDKIPPFHLLRSADLSKATPKDIEILKNKYHLSLIIDMRNDFEYEPKPDVVIEGVEYINVQVLNFEKINMARNTEQFIRKNEHYPLKENYRLIPQDEEAMKKFQHCLDIIEKHDYSKGSILFHCATGKDRTGILAAMIYKKHGYAWKEIVKEYLLSVKAYKKFLFFAPLWTFKKTHSLRKMKETYDFYKLRKSYIDYFKNTNP